MNCFDQCTSEKHLISELYYSKLTLEKLNYFMPYILKLQN